MTRFTNNAIMLKCVMRGEVYYSKQGIIPSRGDERSIRTTPTSSERTEPGSEHQGCSCGAPGGKCVCNEPRSTQSARSMYIYALGRIEPRFPRLSIEKEFAQATGRLDAVGLTDREAQTTWRPIMAGLYSIRTTKYVS